MEETKKRTRKTAAVKQEKTEKNDTEDVKQAEANTTAEKRTTAK